MNYGPYETFVAEFAGRTSDNLKNYQGNFDATNLINCLLGMLVFVHESKDIFWESSIQDYQRDAIITCPDGEEKCKSYDIKFDKNPTSMRKVIRHMRNAIAHCRIEPFYEKNEVKGFIFTDKAKQVTYWSLKLNLEAIRAIAEDLVEQVHGREKDKNRQD